MSEEACPKNRHGHRYMPIDEWDGRTQQCFDCGEVMRGEGMSDRPAVLRLPGGQEISRSEVAEVYDVPLASLMDLEDGQLLAQAEARREYRLFRREIKALMKKQEGAG
jgi:hypothetical protein